MLHDYAVVLEKIAIVCLGVWRILSCLISVYFNYDAIFPLTSSENVDETIGAKNALVHDGWHEFTIRHIYFHIELSHENRKSKVIDSTGFRRLICTDHDAASRQNEQPPTA